MSKVSDRQFIIKTEMGNDDVKYRTELKINGLELRYFTFGYVAGRGLNYTSLADSRGEDVDETTFCLNHLKNSGLDVMEIPSDEVHCPRSHLFSIREETMDISDEDMKAIVEAWRAESEPQEELISKELPKRAPWVVPDRFE